MGGGSTGDAWYVLCNTIFFFFHLLTLLKRIFIPSYHLAGARFKDAFQDPCTYLAVKPFFDVCLFFLLSQIYSFDLFFLIYIFHSLYSLYLWQKERYMVTYSPTKGKVYALLKDQASSDDILKAAFHVGLFSNS